MVSDVLLLKNVCDIMRNRVYFLFLNSVFCLEGHFLFSPTSVCFYQTIQELYLSVLEQRDLFVDSNNSFLHQKQEELIYAIN